MTAAFEKKIRFKMLSKDKKTKKKFLLMPVGKPNIKYMIQSTLFGRGKCL